VTIRAASGEEGGRLKEIAIAAKQFWGYEPDKVTEWADRGDFSPAQLGKLTVFVAEAGEHAIGWCSLEPRGELWWLADLWIGRSGSAKESEAVSFVTARGMLSEKAQSVSSGKPSRTRSGSTRRWVRGTCVTAS
jgi:hypothetical protein